MYVIVENSFILSDEFDFCLSFLYFSVFSWNRSSNLCPIRIFHESLFSFLSTGARREHLK